VIAPSAGQEAPMEMEADGRPAWIAADRWARLPPLLRAALIGSTLVDGCVHIASPYLDRMLRTSYAREVAELVAASGP
jgi:hypothetical protein